jgi:2-polyprenyl-3-methyl-5-hydroxy-6-metoxy-1,4-benzoquinol methylase
MGALLRGATFHYGRLLGNGHRALREVRAALAATPEERVLDFACGAGGFCLAVPGDYLGIDLEAESVAFAHWRWASPRRRFAAMALEDLPDDARFDKAMLVNCVHHLSDDEADAVLGRIARLVRHRVVVVDADLDDSNAFQAFLLAHDRGQHVRRLADLRAVLARHLVIDEERIFRNTPRTVVQVLFVCRPRA